MCALGDARHDIPKTAMLQTAEEFRIQFLLKSGRMDETSWIPPMEKVSELRLALDANYTAAEKVSELGLTHEANVYHR